MNKVYKNYSLTRRENEANCQEFVDTVLSRMGTKFTFDGAFSDFLLKMRTKGVCELEYTPSPEVIKQCNLDQPTYKFETHQQLDEFAEKISKSYAFFKQEFASDWRLLKAFDRAFWLRHYKQPKESTYDPLFNEHGILCCPFNDPAVTATFAGK